MKYIEYILIGVVALFIITLLFISGENTRQGYSFDDFPMPENHSDL